MSDTLNFARALFGQGVGMGWGDEAEAWLRSKVTGRPYLEERERINREYGRFAERYPIIAPATEFAGGVLPAIGAYALTPATGGAAAPAAVGATARGAGALGRVAQALSSRPKTRTAIGGAAGAGAGYASDEDLAVENAVMLAPLGALAGGQAPRILRAARTPYGTAATVGATQGAISGAGSAEPEKRGQGAESGALIGAVAGPAITAATRGGGAAYRALSERVSPSEETITAGAASRINRALEEAGMSPADIETRLAADRARGIPAVAANVDPALVDLAEVVAQRSGPSARRVEAELGEQTGGARERVFQRTRGELGGRDYYADEEAIVNTLRNRASNQYDEAYRFGSVLDPRIMDALQDPQFRVFYDKAREIANREARTAQLRGEDPSRFRLLDIYGPYGPEGSNAITQVPDVRTLDYIKRGIDDVIERGFDGRGLSTREAASLRDLRREFVRAIDEATEVDGVSAYKVARETFAGDAEVRDALRLGRNEFNRLDHEEIGKLFRDMSQAERDAFRTGAVRNVYDMIMVPSSNINAAQRLIGSPETRKSLEQLFDSPSQFNLFASALEREAQLYQQSNRILQGSPTARRGQARERFEEGPEVGAAAADAITGGWVSSLTNMAARAIRGANMSDEISDRVATMLMSRDPTDVAAAVRILEDYGQRAAVSERRLTRGEVGTTGGVMSSVFPAPLPEEEPAR